jgi:hypothetical protein
MIGRFLEISVDATDLLASLAFYERLGFTQVTTGEAWNYPYAAVTDGRLAIGLHQQPLPQSPLLTFVLPDLDRHLGKLEAAGIVVLDRRLGSDVFNEASFAAPGGHLIRLVEARTFSPAPRAPGDLTKLGWFEEIALTVPDVGLSASFWERLGFVPAEEGREPYPHVGLTSDTLNVALLQPGTLARPALTFTDASMAGRIAVLVEAGFEFAGHLPAGLDAERLTLLVAPEGTQILLATAE